MRVLAIALAGVLVSGASCRPSVDSTPTERQANEQGDQRIREATAQLSPPPELVRRPNQDVVCQGLDRSGPDRLTIGRVYELRGLAVDRAAEYVEVLRRYWTSRGYTELDGSAAYPLLRVRHEDGFTLSFSVRNGTAEMSAVLSCIWPDGTPPPSTR